MSNNIRKWHSNLYHRTKEIVTNFYYGTYKILYICYSLLENDLQYK